ncbi:MAG TPA: delta-60 repeat domain-containing protein [Mycobacteriales bacterium]
MSPRRIRTIVVTAAVAALTFLSPMVAQGSVLLPSVVSAVPAGFTPHAINTTNVDSDVDVFAQSGGIMYAGGLFAAVQNSGRTTTYTRSDMFSFNAATGAVQAFAPVFNGRVWAIVPAPDNTLIVGGEFTTVNGVARRGLAKINPTTGALVPGFVPAGMTSGGVFDAQLVNGRLIVSGSFGRRLLALNPATGADTRYITQVITGTTGGTNAGPTRVYRFAVNPAGTQLVGIGNFTSVGGVARRQTFRLDLGTTATVSTWYDVNFDKQCASAGFPAYLRDVDFSPDGSTFGYAATGYISQTGDLGRTVCDAAALYSAASTSPTSRPLWINYTGGDTLHSIAITGATVYVGGHQRWLDNPYGNNNAGPGAVSRPGIGAISASTGKAISWNPGKERGVGAKALYAVSGKGLWVGSDTRLFAGRVHDSIAFCPL